MIERLLPLTAAIALLTLAPRASADANTTRDDGWKTATTITAVGAAATQLLMPRVFYADPETTVGWKARWHVSVLAPVMTLTSLTFFNEFALKQAIKGYRPGCSEKASTDKAAFGTPSCVDYASPSTHAFAAFAAAGHGAAVFVVDTLKWSDGRLNVPALLGNVALPVILAVLTAVGRGAGNWEDTGQIMAGGGAGLAFGALSGIAYSVLQRPECPYGSAAICW